MGIHFGNISNSAVSIGNNGVVNIGLRPAPVNQSSTPEGLQLKPGLGYVEVFFDGHFVKFVGGATMLSDFEKKNNETHFSIGGTALVYRAEEGLFLANGDVLNSETAEVFRSKGVAVGFHC